MWGRDEGGTTTFAAGGRVALSLECAAGERAAPAQQTGKGCEGRISQGAYWKLVEINDARGKRVCYDTPCELRNGERLEGVMAKGAALNATHPYNCLLGALGPTSSCECGNHDPRVNLHLTPLPQLGETEAEFESLHPSRPLIDLTAQFRQSLSRTELLSTLNISSALGISAARPYQVSGAAAAAALLSDFFPSRASRIRCNDCRKRSSADTATTKGTLLLVALPPPSAP